MKEKGIMAQAAGEAQPGWVVPGGRVLLTGSVLSGEGRIPDVRVGLHSAHVVAASPRGLRFVVPTAVEGGTMAVRVDEQPAAVYVEVARALATGIHQVDNPAFDADGRLYVTHSGGRGAKVPVPLYRVSRDGNREPVATDIANPTSLALGPDGAMYVSSRFEGSVYRLGSDDRPELFATELGVPTGLAFAPDGSLFVGDRSGSIFRVSPSRQVEVFATLPPSIAAFHLAVGPDGCLYVSAPTLSSHDVVYRITPDRLVDTFVGGFGRPQGLAFDSAGRLYIADSLAGASGLYRVEASDEATTAELVLTAPMLIGLAFAPAGGLVLASNDTIWRLDVPVLPWRLPSSGIGRPSDPE